MIFRRREWRPRGHTPLATAVLAGRVTSVVSWVEPVGGKWRWTVQLRAGGAATQDTTMMYSCGYERTEQRALDCADYVAGKTINQCRPADRRQHITERPVR